MKHVVIIIALLAFAQTAIRGELVPGSAITAEDLAKHLGVFTRSFTYQRERPFHSLRVELNYKERNSDGTYSVKTSLVTTEYAMQEPATRFPFSIFIDAARSTVITPTVTSGGKGVDIGLIYSTRTPPPLRKGGGYILLRIAADPTKPETEENTKGIVELELKAID